MAPFHTLRPGTTYKGWVDEEEDIQVTVDGRPLRHVAYHSPSGMSWGYEGSGCSDLALSILADYFGETEVDREYLCTRKVWESVPRCWHYHQEFKRAYVSRWDMDGSWMLKAEQITAWLASQPTEEEGVSEPHF